MKPEILGLILSGVTNLWTRIFHDMSLVDWRDSHLFKEKLYFINIGVTTYFYLFLKRKSSKNKTPKNDS